MNLDEVGGVLETLEKRNTRNTLETLERQGALKQIVELIQRVAEDETQANQFLQLISEPLSRAQRVAIQLSMLYIIKFGLILSEVKSKDNLDVKNQAIKTADMVKDYMDYIESIESGIISMADRLEFPDEAK